jgi:DNA-binding CsgD family transcriptional regulator
MGLHLYAGDLGTVASLSAEVEAVTAVTSSQIAPYGDLLLAAWQGREAEASTVIKATIDEVLPRGEAIGVSLAHWASAVLYNGLGRYQAARTAAEQAIEHPEDLEPYLWSLAELVEAAIRSGDLEAAIGALGRLTQTTRPSGTDWAVGIESRSRALVSEGERAEILYREAIERLDCAGIHAELARGHLLYGEWLRRENRRLDAREQLGIAHEMFAAFGMEAFAERTRLELETTGAHARRRTVEARDDLTPQEAHISRLAAEGATNQEIAAQLFISPNTVDYHLRKAFRKLGVKSRHQLKQHVLAPAGAEPVARSASPPE